MRSRRLEVASRLADGGLLPQADASDLSPLIQREAASLSAFPPRLRRRSAEREWG